ncbi:MAG: AraC family transcriptional regulator [Hydrogenophaga sp.]|jgi:AraC-like DNA-binding protein|uniref:AraC family transcriptional regulator n=1 Tax=Hydrogenophaga sp. TaxID=1904254 RepID=UPI001D300BE8|nr:AraC family transcriptional regulator [Hydrogenophaga sp.]MBW0169843.1 AraC family transcriptional regulator [Hydrogenophaga sp.]MBW0185895.1 AraC family transcriptional regulator [Hydrogenophaga sp.]
MTVRSRTAPRQIKPELEHELVRSPNLGYESSTDVGFVRCLSHGFPTPLARWHYHDEYELHLITATSGKVFVGDWIGPFQAGQLVLTGPRLPHNWVSMDMPEGGVALRDLVIQFSHEPLVLASETIPELAEVLPLLERAKHGIEFFGLSDTAEAHWHKVKGTRGLKRFTAFCDFLSDLAACTDYRLLSSVQLQSTDDANELDQIDAVVSRITDHLADEHSAAALASELGMSESKFSRFFRKATGNTFTDFVNRVRISRACQLLMDTEQQITHICYEVGFNNVANFNRRFLDIKGMTPSEFRRQSLTRFRGSN